MKVLVVGAPAPVVTLELAKPHLAVDADDWDTLIEAYIAAATGQIDGPEGGLGRAIGVQVLEARLDRFPPFWHRGRGAAGRSDVIPLPCPPLISIDEIAYDDPAGSEQIMSPADYKLIIGGVALRSGASWPLTSREPESVRIRYTAGYATPPRAIVLAILLMVGDAFQNRQTTDLGRVAKIPMSVAVEDLLSTFRHWFVDPTVAESA